MQCLNSRHAAARAGSSRSLGRCPRRAFGTAQQRPPCSVTASSSKLGRQLQQQQQQQPPPQQPPPKHQLLQRCAAIAAAAALALTALPAGTPLLQPASAADPVKVGTCLLQKCQLQLARCLGDPKCLQNIVCLNTCNGLTPEGEAACQIRCGDLYGDAAVDTFNACAVSEQKCVPQRADEGLYPVPCPDALDSSFDLNAFTGRWFITAGLNPLFDAFDCQEHFFAVPEPGRMAAKINWRINKPNGDFIERSVIQTFVQVPEQHAIMLNHGNEYLHYEDDWYILASKPDSYVVVYYRGKNDAWDGYGGAVVYTKARQLPEELVPELTAAVEKVGLKWGDFIITDNSCKPHPPPKSLVEEIEEEAGVLERGIERGAVIVEQDLEGGLMSFGRGFTVLEGELSQEVTAELKQAAKALAKVEKQVADEARLLERELESEVKGVQPAMRRFLRNFTPAPAKPAPVKPAARAD